MSELDGRYQELPWEDLPKRITDRPDRHARLDREHRFGTGEVARTAGSELELPESYTEIELGMSNFDHSIDDGFEDALKAGQVFGRHAGWEFNGLVWWDGMMFCERVSRHHVHVGTYRASSLRDLMAVVNDQWGWD